MAFLSANSANTSSSSAALSSSLSSSSSPSSPSFISASLICSIASSVSDFHSSLSDSAAQRLALDVEEKLLDIIQNAKFHMKHTKRSVLTTADIMHVLKLRNAQQILTYAHTNTNKTIHTNKQQENTTMMNGSTSSSSNSNQNNSNSNSNENEQMNGIVSTSSSSSGPSAAAALLQKLFPLTSVELPEEKEELLFINDPLLSLASVINGPLTQPPVDSSFVLHWLAVDGIQTATPLNPTVQIKPDNSSASTLSLSSSSSTALSHSSSSSSSSSSNLSGPLLALRPVLHHVLSREQQLYYEHICSAIRSDEEKIRLAALTSIKCDEGLSQLVPFFVHFISDGVFRSLTSLKALRSFLSLAAALLLSPYLSVEHYLHQLIPAIVTCCVSKRLCDLPTDDHWSVREYAADVLAFILSKYSHLYPNLRARLAKLLLDAWLNVKLSLPTHYGAVIALQRMGNLFVQTLLLPYLRAYLDVLAKALNDATNPIKRMEAMQVYCALLHATGDYLRQSISSRSRTAQLQQQLLAAAQHHRPVSTPSVRTEAVESVSSVGAALLVSGVDSKVLAVRGRLVDGEEEESEILHQAMRRAVGGESAEAVEKALMSDEQVAMSVSELSEIFGEALNPYLHGIFHPFASAQHLNHTFL